MAFITSYASVRHQCLFKDGHILWDGSKEVDMEKFLVGAYTLLQPDYPKFYKMDQLSRLGFLCCEVLLGKRKLKEEYAPAQLAIVLSNASSSLDTDKKYMDTTAKIPSPSLFVYTLPNIVAGELSIRHGIKGESAFFISQQFDPQLIAGFAGHVVASGANACIAGWVETYGKTHDVFLYLIENEKAGLGLAHTAEQVNLLYHA